MKKTIAIISIVLSAFLILSSCNTNNKIHVGMTYGEFIEALGEENPLCLSNYVFFADENNGSLLVAKFSNKELKAFKYFSQKTPLSSDFLEIVNGMDVFEVTEKVGAPVDSRTFGLLTWDYETQDGKTFRINWGNDNQESYKLIVASVEEIELPVSTGT